ncbi:hypothetical protein [Actinoplanes sp. NPDC051494]|uniref:hypothetical protein n=1 Tax=Actinoplanes sp. NPDC051494 TaxID=3363907 RepID=UPI00379C0705
MSHNLGRLGVAVAVCLLAGGLLSVQAEPARGPVPVEPALDVLTRRDDGLGITGGQMGLSALVSGTVQLVDGCFLLGGNVVVWPFGTRAAGTGITLPDGAPLKAGDAVQGGGGYYQPDYRDLRTIADDTTVHRVVSCARKTGVRAVAVFNSYSNGPIRKA